MAATLTAGGLLACGVASGASPLPKLTTATVLGDRVHAELQRRAPPGRRAAGRSSSTERRSGPRAVVVRRQAACSSSAEGGLQRRRGARGREEPALTDRREAQARRHDACRTGRRPGALARSEPWRRALPGEGPTDADTFLQPDRIRVLAVQVDYDDVRASALDGLARTGDGGRLDSRALVQSGFGGCHTAAGGGPDAEELGRLRLFGSVECPQGVLPGARVDDRRRDRLQQLRRHHRHSGAKTAGHANLGAGRDRTGRRRYHGRRAGAPPLRDQPYPVADLRSVLQLAGLPELPGGYVGEWDPMGYGRNETGLLGMLAWHRRKLGWMEPSQVRCLGSDAARGDARADVASRRGQGRGRADQQDDGDRPRESATLRSRCRSLPEGRPRVRGAHGLAVPPLAARRRPYRQHELRSPRRSAVRL